MAVIFSRTKLDEIKRALDGVRSVGQAWAVVNATQALANTIAGEIRQTFLEDSWRTQARKDIYDYQASVQREAKALLGAAATADASRPWASIRPVVQTMWNYCLIVQGQFPPDDSTAMERLGKKMSLAAESLTIALSDAPDVVVAVVAKSVKTAVKVAKAVVVPVAGLVGETAGALLGPVKWILFGIAGIAVVGGIGYLVVMRGGKV